MLGTALGLLTSKAGRYVIVAAVIGLGFWYYGHTQRQAGYAAHEAEMAQAAAKAERERSADDERLRRLSDYDLCAEYLRARGMPIDACEQLRGVQPE